MRCPSNAEDRPAARGDGVDGHHGRAHPHARHLRLELALELARVVRHVGGGAAHVEADDLLEPGGLRRAHHPMMPPAGPDRIESLPWKRCASVRPPLDCMNISLGPGPGLAPVFSSLATWSTYLRNIGDR
jgi:hypothetical protein